MPKEHGISQGENFSPSTSSLLSAAAARFTRQGSSRHDASILSVGSVSANKYRIATTADAHISTEETPALVVTQATGIPTSPVFNHGSKAMSKNPPLLKRQATEKGSKSPVRFADLVRQASKLKIDKEPEPILTVNRSPTQHSKLPQKIRSSVSRMRSQLSLLSGSSSSNNSSTSPDAKARPRHSSVVSHAALSPTAATAVPSTTSPSNRPRYSRQSLEISSKQVEKNTDRRASSIAAMRKLLQAQRSQHSLDTDATTVLQFMELLRPLQSSMSSLRDDGAGSMPSGSDDEDDEDDEEADALFRRHEREGSRILRICCSLDNLLFSIADDVQENKHDVIAIASGPARKLVELIFTGINQIADAMAATQAEDGMPSLTAKDERYLREFLVEIADRWSSLDELLRSVFVSTLQRTREELSDLQAAHSELKEQKQTLELEMFELREFHSGENAAAMAVSSNFMRLADHKQNKHKGPETEEDERLVEYDLKERDENGDGKKQTADEEIETLKAQCSEYGRLLEMAKQEIRLTHQERQSQHARLVELSQSLLRDEEVAQLRNELQAEKKRVKILEMEGLRMRECQVDLDLKIQSLQINQPGPGTTAKSASRNAAASIPPEISQTGSGDVRQDVVNSASIDPRQQPPDEATNATRLLGSDSTESQSSLVQGTLAPSQPNATNVSCSSIPKTPWLSRVLEKGVKSGGAAVTDEDDGLIRLFLANLLMGETELEAAAAQAKLRKRSNVPTLGAAPRPTPTFAASPTKKKKKNANGAQDPNLVVISVEEWVSDTVVVASVRQLIWVFYELYLMAEETRRVLYPQQVKWYRDSASARSPPPLSSYVLHYFLERHPHEEGALSNLRRFITVLAKLRGEYGDVRLFCEFLDGTRGREELHFLLWSLQAVDNVDLGVSYDDATPVTLPADSRQGRYVCTLKALYLTRIVYRLLHAKSLKKLTPLSPIKATCGKTKAAVAPLAVPTPSSPKKRRKTRPLSAGAVSTATTQASLIALPSEPDPPENPAPESIIDRAKAAYSNAIQANSGYPLTLETFNAIVLGFAVSPSRQELLDRLGSFYQLTGDERKISLDVFLILLSETFATQLQWRRAQLQALFVRLAKEEEVERLLAAKKLQDELDAEAALAAASVAKKTRGDPNETSKKAVKKVKKRERRVGIDKSPDRHLKGLSRERLRKFLVQGGLVNESDVVHQRDYDALYVAILEVTKETMSEIHFEQVYDALSRFEMLGNDAFAVDFTSWLADDALAVPTSRSSDASTARDQQIVETWRMFSIQTLTVTENDQNMFIRHVTRELTRRVQAALTNFAEGKERGFTAEMEAVNAVQNCLRFAWSVASRRVRSSKRSDSRMFESCLTEFFYLNQAVKMMINGDGHNASNADLALLRTLPVCGVDDDDQLAVFYDCRFVKFDDCPDFVLAAKDSDTARQNLQRVLQRYALHIAHLFESNSLARFTDVNDTGGLTRDQWLKMAHDIGLLVDPVLPVSVLEALFAESCTQSIDNAVESAVLSHATHFHCSELVVDKPQFVALLVHTAVKRYQASVYSTLKPSLKTKRQAALPSVAQVVEKFCQFVVVPHAFHHRNQLHHEDFQRQLSCPLVARVLLEHRAFLRQLFFHFAKCEYIEHGEEQAPEPRAPVAAMLAVDVFDDSRRVKTTRNSMTLPQFASFLEEYQLYESPSKAASSRLELRLNEAGTQHLFRAVMAIESDDLRRMEFDEFTSAVSAIAVLHQPHPFVKLHVKIDAFVAELRAIHASKRDPGRRQRFGR